MVGGNYPTLCGDRNKGLVRVNLGYGNRRESFVIRNGGIANCSRQWQLLHIIEGENPSLPLELAPVPSLVLFVSQKLHNVPDLQSQLILIGRNVVKDSSEELLGCRNEKQGWQDRNSPESNDELETVAQSSLTCTERQTEMDTQTLTQ